MYMTEFEAEIRTNKFLKHESIRGGTFWVNNNSYKALLNDFIQALLVPNNMLPIEEGFNPRLYNFLEPYLASFFDITSQNEAMEDEDEIPSIFFWEFRNKFADFLKTNFSLDFNAPASADERNIVLEQIPIYVDSIATTFPKLWSNLSQAAQLFLAKVFSPIDFYG